MDTWTPITGERWNDGAASPEPWQDVELIIRGFMDDSGR